MSTTPSGQREATLFGHPRGLTFLFTTEMWERFSYYGMRAILILYLVNFLLLPGHVETVFGYQAMKSLFESFAGPLDVQPFSSLIYGTYTALVYFTPLIGGFLSDRFFGQRKTVIFGALVMAIGEFTLMMPDLLFVGLLLLIIGNGASSRTSRRRSAICIGRRFPHRPRLFDLLCRHQCRRVLSRPWCAERWARRSAGSGASSPPASAC